MDEDTLEPLAELPQLKGKAAKAAKAERLRQHQRVFAASLIPATTPEKLQTLTDIANTDQRVKAETKPSALEMVGAAIAGNTSNVIYDALFRERFEPVAGYKPMMKELPPDADTDLVERVAGSTSPEETAGYVSEFQDEQTRVNAVMSRGVLPGMVLQFGAEIADVTSWVAPFAVAKGLAKIGKGSDVLFDAGKTAQGYTSAVTENILSGTAIEAFKQTVQGEFKPVDLGVSMVADSLIGVGTGWLSARNAANKLLDSAADSAATRELDLVSRAEQELGKDAPVEALTARVAELRKGDINSIIADSVADSNKIIEPTPEQASAVSAAPATAMPEAVAPVAKFETNVVAGWENNFVPGGRFAKTIAEYTDGTVPDLKALKAKGAGIHASGAETPETRQTVMAVQSLAKRFFPDSTISLHFGEVAYEGGFAHAKIGQVNDKMALIRVDPELKPDQMIRAAVHEVGHFVFNREVGKLGSTDLDKLKRAYKAFQDEALGPSIDGNKARAMRYSITNVDQNNRREFTTKPTTKYDLSFDEFAAEQFVKYVDKDVLGENKLGLTASVVKVVKAAIEKVLMLFKAAKREGVDVSEEFETFFDSLFTGRATKADGGVELAEGPMSADQLAAPAQVVDEIQQDPDAVRFGLNLASVGTPAERAQVQAMLALHKKAEAWEKQNPLDDAWNKRAENLSDTFGVASIGLTMLKSPSPLVRMLATELLEDASGVAGKRRNTAAISKHILNNMMLGNVLNDVQGAYNVWKAGKPGAGLKDDLFTGNMWDQWNKEIAKEIEARAQAGQPVNPDPNLTAAVNSIEAAYQRMADAQRKVNTLGSEGLPKTSVGYMPHKMNPQAVMNLTNAQRQTLHSVLVDQFVSIEGWDITFSDRLASTYMQRVRDRAAGDYGSAMSGHSMAEIVRESLVAMRLPDDIIEQHMDKFAKGALGHTKARIKLDLNRVYSTPDGDFKLMDVFETDQLELLRSHAGRVSGDVALTKHGVRGKPALDLIRRAMQYGEDGKRIGPDDKAFEAFDQMVAEFRNEPFGNATGRWMDRAMQANSLVRLGGVIWNQLAETLNGIAHVGVIRTFESLTSLPRLRSEIIALSKGEKVDNPILDSIELAGGAEFGTDAYKFVMPFDSPNHAYPSYGQDTLTVADRLLRGAGYLQGKLSGWRALHSAQQRGMAEQITHKMLRYIREGKDDVALQQFGVTDEMRNYMRANLDTFAKFDGNGRLINLDITKIEDADMRESIVQTVHRGTQQIIQGTFIGERGKWAHDGLMKLMTQFRTFSITSMEKQWGRQRNSRGAYAAFGLLLGTMTLSIPIYMARTYAASVGRPDQEEFLEERLAPDVIARATLNYAASSGIIGDVMDLLSATLPESLGVTQTGGRSGQESDFVGNYIAPASSLVNDIWKYAQSPMEVDDAAKLMPFRNIPYLVPLFNQAREE